MAKECSFKIDGNKLIVDTDIVYNEGIPLFVFNYAVKSKIDVIEAHVGNKIITFNIPAIITNEQETECGHVPGKKDDYLFLRGNVFDGNIDIENGE